MKVERLGFLGLSKLQSWSHKSWNPRISDACWVNEVNQFTYFWWKDEGLEFCYAKKKCTNQNKCDPVGGLNQSEKYARRVGNLPQTGVKTNYIYLKPFVPPFVWQSHACERAWHAHQVHWPYHPLGMGNSTKEAVPGRQIWWPSFVDLPQPLQRPWQPPALYAGITFSSQLYLRDGTRKGRHLQFEDQEWTALIDECDAISISDPLSDVYHLESVGK